MGLVCEKKLIFTSNWPNRTSRKVDRRFGRTGSVKIGRRFGRTVRFGRSLEDVCTKKTLNRVEFFKNIFCKNYVIFHNEIAVTLLLAALLLGIIYCCKMYTCVELVPRNWTFLLHCWFPILICLHIRWSEGLNYF